MLLNMKRLISIVLAGATLLLGLGSCMKEEDRAIFDPSQCTAPVLNGYDVVEGAVSATYTPATLNTNPKILNHMLAIVSLDGNAVSKRVNSTDKDGVLSVSATNLTRALQELGCEEGSTHSLEMAIRASNLKTPDDQNPGSYIESVAHIVIDAYEIILPSGDPYARYTQPSEWSLIGSFNDWGGDYEMWTNGTLHVAKAVQLDANAEVKFRKDASWDVNFGYAEGISSYVLGEEFDLRPASMISSWIRRTRPRRSSRASRRRMTRMPATPRRVLGASSAPSTAGAATKKWSPTVPSTSARTSRLPRVTNSSSAKMPAGM